MNESTPDPRECAIIIGAGPAGLTAAYELAHRSNIRPIVLEKSEYMGGISRTVNYKGNRIDIGGHRFFSKSDRVMDWWLQILPLQNAVDGQKEITYQNQTRTIQQSGNTNPARSEAVMLIRERLSRIYYMRKFFSYPISLSPQTLKNLGLLKLMRIGVSYSLVALFPRKNEKTLEDFLINRFGKELYLTFFKSYTEKVWGVPCNEISAEWGAQRIKGLSIYKTLLHAAKKIFGKLKPAPGKLEKSTETSLIERFMYPKYGPGQMWEEVARRVKERGGEILSSWTVERIVQERPVIRGVHARNLATGESRCFTGSYFFSTMPIRELMKSLEPAPPPEIRKITDGLIYRDFLIVGALCKSSRLASLKDNWIYIQDAGVQAGRMQIFNNWSPYMVADPTTQWIGLEYFCNDTDPLWHEKDADLLKFAEAELEKMGLLGPKEMLDGTVVRMPKSYPAYFGTYDQMPVVIEWVNRIDNLYLIGRNGMHKYNNQDHSMLTAMTAVDNILSGESSRDKLWSLNAEMEYHEEK